MNTATIAITPEIEQAMKEYGLTAEEAAVSVERRKVYGDPEQNHRGIAMSWAGLLQPWAAMIAGLRPIPPHVVALMMSALKNNRKRVVFHEDNYIDAKVYDAFAQKWQKEYDADPSNERPQPVSLNLIGVTAAIEEGLAENQRLKKHIEELEAECRALAKSRSAKDVELRAQDAKIAGLEAELKGKAEEVHSDFKRFISSVAAQGSRMFLYVNAGYDMKTEGLSDGKVSITLTKKE